MTPESASPASRTQVLGRVTRGGVLLAAVLLAWPWPHAPQSAPAWVPALSPFVALGALIASRGPQGLHLWALPVAALAWFHPRGFCRFGCPVGLLQETVERWRPNPAQGPTRIPRIGAVLAGLTLGGAILGYPMFLWLDPLAILQSHLNAWGCPSDWAALCAGLALPTLLVFAWARPRCWCQRLCPLGGTQDLLSRCRQATPGRAPAADSQAQAGAAARRGFLLVGGGACLAWVAGSLRRAGEPPLRPPGVRDENHFAGVCVRCGNCARVCPSRVIRPDLGAHGILGLLTPVLSFAEDYCREDCHRCHQVCPSGAIPRLSLDAKRRRVIGPASLDIDLCLMANGRECIACIQRCPYGALARTSPDGGFTSQPELDPRRCTGCGACEAVCPVRPRRAIRVVPQPGILPGPPLW